MIEKKELEGRYEFYCRHLKEVILPFSMKRALDLEHGGYYSCFTNDGRTMVSKNKYMWSQGRFIWIFSKLAGMEEFKPREREEFRDCAKLGVDFVLEHGFLKDGRCVFLMDEEGHHLASSPDGEFAGSTFADCYVASGFAQYARLTGDRNMLIKAMELYDRIMGMYETRTFQTVPFYVPEGMKCHLTAMILCGMHWDYIGMMRAFSDGREERIKRRYEGFCREILNDFSQDNHLVLEMMGEDGTPRNRFLGRYVNTGHTMEGMWFICHYALENGSMDMIHQAGLVMEETVSKSWDEVYGGLRYYMGSDGGTIGGDILDEREHATAIQMEKDCNNKLWWVHTESLYALLLYALTQEDERMWKQFERLEEYVFRTFPNPDTEIGEWIFLRNQDGTPVSSEVGGRLPIKDPFHTIRNLVLMMELLKEKSR